ncbi:MAG: class IV adenylate cyclase [Oscillospiraceae bacterium]|jgi:predicted adenylyl cyclase CyaB|nr:class IV adenylate cyclase [Oscillospiraceae bacterium]
MRNLEVKVEIQDRGHIIGLLKDIGAEYVRTMKQCDYYFETGANKTKLRIIDGSECQLITYRRIERRGRKDSSYDIVNLNAEEKDLLLQTRKIVKRVEKIRELWMYRKTRIHIDHVEHLGNFLELETVMKDISTKDAKREFKSVVDGLEIDLAGSVAASYSDFVPVFAD